MDKEYLKQGRTLYIGFVATSVDGRISLSNKIFDTWNSKEDWEFLQNSLSCIEAVVVGRNTYELASKRLRKRNTFVLSSRPKTSFKRGTVTFLNPKKVSLSKLLEGYKSVAVLGGGAVYQFMLENKLLDEIFVTVEPFILGRGKEMFIGGNQTTPVKLLSIKQLNDRGTLLLHYQIKYEKPYFTDQSR